MDDALLLHRIQFAFTVTFHYIFPQLTMGLALLIVAMKTIALWKSKPIYNNAAKFIAKIFALNFTLGVVTGIPLEFEFGTNWARFSTFAGGVIGQTLAMEGMFAFFLESTFLGLFIFGEKKLSPRMHYFSAVMVFVGSWLSGYFIVATNAWMQHPVGYKIIGSEVVLTSFSELLFNPWAFWQYLHTMLGATITGSFAIVSIGAYYLLMNKNLETAKIYLRVGILFGLISTILVAFPTGDYQVKQVLNKQPATFAAMEGLFETKKGAELILIGQPDMEKLKIDNPIYVPKLLSFLSYLRWEAEIKGLNAFDKSLWPTNIPLLYYSYHIMIGLGTIFILIMFVSAIYLYRKKIYETKWLLWILMMSFPFPFISNIAGWWTAEFGRQPWLIYGLMKTADGTSLNVSAGNALFTLIGFGGMYFLLGVMFLFLFLKLLEKGPEKIIIERKK